MIFFGDMKEVYLTKHIQKHQIGFHLTWQVCQSFNHNFIHFSHGMKNTVMFLILVENPSSWNRILNYRNSSKRRSILLSLRLSKNHQIDYVDNFLFCRNTIPRFLVMKHLREPFDVDSLRCVWKSYTLRLYSTYYKTAMDSKIYTFYSEKGLLNISKYCTINRNCLQ